MASTPVYRSLPGTALLAGGVGGPLMLAVEDEVEVGPDDNIFTSPSDQQVRDDENPA